MFRTIYSNWERFEIDYYETTLHFWDLKWLGLTRDELRVSIAVITMAERTKVAGDYPEESEGRSAFKCAVRYLSLFG